MHAPPATCPVKVWDIAIRLFHWLLVALVAFSWWTYETGRMQWHMLSGYSILTLVLFRILWGLFGSENARFGQFLRGPSAVIAHLRHITRREVDTELGHNAMGGWMVIALVLLLLAQAGTGLCADDDIFTQGPLVRYVGPAISAWCTWAHGVIFNLLLIAVGLHVAALIFYRVIKGQNLILPMLSGRKTVPTSTALNAPRHASLLRAVVLLGIAGSIVAVIARL